MYTRIIISINLLIYGCFSFGQDLMDANSSVINQYFNIQTEANQDISHFYTNVSRVEIHQLGNYNQTSVETISDDTQCVIQNGNANLYEMYAYYYSQPVDIQVVQNGNHNTLLIFGQNDLTSQMQIIQNTNHQTLIINNY
jgi:hypothetical protein